MNTNLRLLVLGIMLFAFGTLSAQPTWLWAGKGTSGGQDAINGVLSDADGNSYYVGTFGSQIQFTGFSMNSAGGTDVFVIKVNTAGTVVWALRAGGSNNDTGRDICTDNNGDLWITGEYLGNVSFGSTNLTGNDAGTGITYGSDQRFHVCGNYTGTPSFGPISLPNATNSQIFYANSPNYGNWSYAISAGGGSNDYVNCIDVDSKAYLYLGGSFYGSATFGSISLTGNATNDAFFAKMDSSKRPTDPVMLFPANFTIDLPPSFSLAWRYSSDSNPPPSVFKLYINGSLYNSFPYSGDKVYSPTITYPYNAVINWSVVAQTSAGVTNLTPGYWCCSVMAQPGSSQTGLVPTQVVYQEYTSYSGSSPFGITMPGINLGSGTTTPVFVFTPAAYLSNHTFTAILQDKPDHTMPNASACLASFRLGLPQNTQMTINLSPGFTFSANELVRWNGSAWEDITSSAAATFGTNSVSFSFSSTSRGEEEFAINDGTGSTLPVTMSSFTAIQTSTDLAQLNWVTASEPLCWATISFVI